MTVIKGNKSYFIRPGSAQASDTESLHLGSASASDTESLNNEAVARPRAFQALPLKPVLGEEQMHLKKASGKKKLRRYQNRCILQTLQEEDESESTVIIIMESFKGPFARLLEDSKAMEFWNNFIEKSEEEQANIITAFSNKCNRTKIECNQSFTDQRLPKISSRVKRTFKTKKNLSMETVKGCEDNMLEFFTSTPHDVYIKSPNTSFDRLLLKAIAHHHGLQINNVINQTDKPCIEIFNKKSNWVPASCFLTDFIEQLR